jgi:hypothetical protein
MEIIRQIDSETLTIKRLKGFLGKKVKINIEVMEETGQPEQKPRPLGKYKLGKELDNLNIRNLAYDEN